MLTEFVYKDRIFIISSVRELRLRLAEHARNYSTLKELLADVAPD